MKTLLCVLGVLMGLCGIVLASTPIVTFWETSYFFVFLLLVYGAASMARGVTKKEYGGNFLFGILSVVAGLLILFVPGLKFMTSSTIIYLMATWFLLQGAVFLVFGVRGKKTSAETKKWLGNLVMGVFSIILGIYSLIRPVALAFSMGVLIGIYFIISGINLVILGIQLEKKA